MQMTPGEFEQAVAEAMDLMPARFAELMDNVVVQVRELPSRATMLSLGLDPARGTLFGLYTGVPLDRRGGWYGGVLPDVIELYRLPLTSSSHDRRELLRQIQLTLLHEIGHHFGFAEHEMVSWEEEFAGLEPGG